MFSSGDSSTPKQGSLQTHPTRHGNTLQLLATKSEMQQVVLSLTLLPGWVLPNTLVINMRSLPDSSCFTTYLHTPQAISVHLKISLQTYVVPTPEENQTFCRSDF